MLSYTVKVIDPQGFDEMFTIRGDEPADYFSKIAALKKWLVDHGYTPTNAARRSPQPSNGNAAPAAANVPTCQYHGPMKPSNFGGFYCPKKLHDGSYCQSKADAQPTPAQAAAVAQLTAPQPLIAPMPQAQAVQYATQPPATNGAPPPLFDDAPPPDFDNYYTDQN
jgi:hypothetical protein